MFHTLASNAGPNAQVGRPVTAFMIMRQTKVKKTAGTQKECIKARNKYYSKPETGNLAIELYI